ncbi:MAG TPA: hypothetical protein VHB79_37500 [Polyangiaceae bacterium]|nr:hypothetical protein [Polyangiaceae bacterium]
MRQPPIWLACLACLACLSLLALASHAQGAQELLRFEWKAPDGCSTREQVLAHAEKLLGRAPEAALTEALALSAEISADPRKPNGGFQLLLSSRSATSTATRDVSADSCQELADAAALLLALTIDPNLKADAPAADGSFTDESNSAAPHTEAAAEPAPPNSEPAGVGHAPALPASRDDERKRSERTHWLAGAELGLLNRRLPGVSPGALVHGGIAGRSWLWLLSVGFFPARHAGIAGSAAGGDLELGSLGTDVGYSFAFQSLGVTPLAGVELDWLHGSGSGVARPASADLLLIGFEAGARVGLGVSRSWTVLGQGLVSVLAQRPRFVLDGLGEVFRPEPWGVRFGLGAEWREP